MTRTEIIKLRDDTFEMICALIGNAKKGNGKLNVDEKTFTALTTAHAVHCRQLEANDFPAEMKTTALAIKVDEGKLRQFMIDFPAYVGRIGAIADDLKLLAARGGVV